jgi:hypothetical protein
MTGKIHDFSEKPVFFVCATLQLSWGGNKEAETVREKEWELVEQKKDGSAIVTSKPKNQKNVTTIVSQASREATRLRLVPDVAASGSTSFKQKKKSD